MSWSDLPHVKRAEFLDPDHLDVRVARAAQETREWLRLPMMFSKVGNVIRHPHGDAVSTENSKAHSQFSLHLWGIDHAQSKLDGRWQFDATRMGLAIDWDCPGADLLDVYHAVERLNVWTGIGIYPYWHNPGLHTDLRERRHPDYGARWYVDRAGTYRSLNIASLRQLIAERGNG